MLIGRSSFKTKVAVTRLFSAAQAAQKRSKVATGIITIVCAGIGSWLTALDPRYSRVGRQRLLAWGVGAIVFGIGAITDDRVLFYVALVVVVAVVAEWVVTKRPMGKDG
jgi:hypothetical protein